MTAGEFDPLLAVRADTTFYYNAVDQGENVVVQPQGGAVLRGGLPLVAPQRGALSAVDLSAATITAPQGGTVGNLTDGDEATSLLTTGPMGTVDPYVVWQVDFGAPSAEIVAFDMIGLKLSASGSASMVIQSSPDGVTWTTRASVIVSDVEGSRRLAAAPGSVLASARYWRFARVGGALDLGALVVEVDELRAWSEGAQGEVKLFDVVRSADAQYVFAVTAGNADIFRVETLTWVAAIAVEYGEADIVNVTHAQSRDQVIFFNRDYPQWTAFRQGNDALWDFGALVFSSVTQFAWGDSTVSGGVSEVQLLTIDGAATGNLFRIELNGEFTADITVDASDATTAASLETAIETLTEISSVSVTVKSAKVFEITYDGDEADQPQQLLIPIVVTGSGVYEIKRIDTGAEPTAPLWDADHGYPSCGTFYQGRFFQGGFRDRPDLTAASRAGSFFDFELDDDVGDDSPLLFAADTDEQVEVVAIHAGRHLQVFTTSGEFFIPSEPITPTNLALKQTTRIGSVLGLPTFDVEGATLFVQRNGRAVHEYLFVDTEQSYQANAISLLATHLVADPKALAMRRRQSASDADIYFIANTGNDASGVRVPMAMVTILRSQQVTAFTRLTTPNGDIEAVCSLQRGEIFVASKRTDGGVERCFIEAWDTARQLDGGGLVSVDDVTILAADGVQTDFAWTFTTPGTVAEIAVHTRVAGQGAWELVDPSEYVTNLSIGRVEFVTAPANGREVRINRRLFSITLPAGFTHLEGESVALVVDGFPEPDKVVTSGAITLDNYADFDVEFGHFFPAKIRLLPPRPSLGGAEVFGTTKMRIPSATVTVERTGVIEVGIEGQALQVLGDVPLPATLDATLEETLTSGPLRVWGMAGWEVDPRLVVQRAAATPFNVLGINYAVRF